MKNIFGIFTQALLMSSLALCSCSDYDPPHAQDIEGIPLDKYATPAPEVSVEEATATIPNIHFSLEGSKNITNMIFTGIEDEDHTGEWLRLYGTNSPNQNVWVEVDGKPKGILVENLASQGQESRAAAEPLQVMVDLVFLVDNSATMTEESNAVADGLTAWATDLAGQGLDIKFGCVGYDASGLNGAIDMCDLEDMDAFLNRDGRNGRDRTHGYEGVNGASLAEKSTSVAGYHTTVNAECGVRALRFANDCFANFRFAANRIYVNLTDEPNQPVNDPEWSVEYVENNWSSNQGTVHTVYSDISTFTEIQYQKEYPWRLSEYTGGTDMLDVPSSFAGVSLDDLPVTGAMSNSHRIRFVDNTVISGSKHNIKVTVSSGGTTAVKEFEVEFE